MRLRRLGAFVVLAVAGVLLTGGTAHATIDHENGITCHGTGDIGKTHIDSNQERAEIPKSGTVRYFGETSPATTNHKGRVLVKGPLGKIELYSWASKNESRSPSDTGTKTLPSWIKQLSGVELEVTGRHSGVEGSCDGHITLVVAGGVPAGPAAGATALAALSGLGMLAAGRARPGKGLA